MSSMDTFVKGECMEMCPEDEIKLREREGLLHILETVSRSMNSKRPSADRCKMVKSFCRSAAGKTMQDPKYLRPTLVLLKTVHYLIGSVMTNANVPWNVVYDFITDRLRSVRQDMVIQNLPVVDCIAILQPIVNFHAYASYRLCNEAIVNFDPVLNKRHFQECIKRLLHLYDECEHMERKTINTKMLEIQSHFEALYIVLNLGNIEALTRGIGLSRKLKTTDVKLAIAMSLAFCQNNFVKVCKLMKKLPSLLIAVASLHLPKIRRQAFKVMSVAYNSRNLTFPMDVLQKLFCYNNLEDVISDCKFYGLTCSQVHGVYFVKTNFKDVALVLQPTHLDIVDGKLNEIKISEFILNK